MIPYIVGAAPEIPPMRDAAEALRDAELRFRLAAESVSDVIYEWNIATGAIDIYGHSGERLGVSVEEMPRSFAEFEALLHPDDRARVLDDLWEALRTRADAKRQYRVVTRCGGVRHWSCTACIVVSPAGDPVRQIGAISDVTDRVQAQQRIAAMNAELRQLSARLVRLQDEERRRFARELHDSTAQTLTALSFSLQSLATMPGMASIPEANRVLRESAALVESSIREVRTMSCLLHPVLLDELGLEPALRNLVAGFEQRTGIAVRLQAAAGGRRRSDCVEVTAFRFVQEALSNVHRHTSATWVEVRIDEAAGALSLEVTDGGAGFPAEAFDAAGELVLSGVGIAGMRERARYLGGALTIRSTPQGSTVRMVIPIDNAS
jgi:PAS domain S-box-containing protein